MELRRNTTSQAVYSVYSIKFRQEGKLRWSEISFTIFSKSNGEFYRTPQKCREKWINHLDPEVNRSKWTVP
jgi:hypothetical protein